jgi:hypothetical protein
MTLNDEERQKIEERAIRRAREEANIENRVANLESGQKELRTGFTWMFRGGVAVAGYLLTELLRFILGGGALK